MKIQTTTIKVKKTYVFAFFFFIIIAVTVFMLFNAFTEMTAGTPDPVEDYSDMSLIQLDAPAEDAVRVKISTTAGDMTAVIYKDECPVAADIFISAAESGDYNGIDAVRYEQGSVFTLDAPEIDGIYKAELHKNLWPFKGALCMNDSGDIIFINTVSFTDEEKEYLSAEEGEMPEVRHAFYEHGGVPNYSGQYAVFGQVVEGMDVLEKIAAADMEEEIKVTGTKIIG